MRRLREGRRVFCLKRHRPPAVGKWRVPLCGPTAPDSLGPATLITGPATRDSQVTRQDRAVFLAWGYRSTMSRTDECRAGHGWPGAATGRSCPRRQPPDNGVREPELTQEAPQPGPSRRAPPTRYSCGEWSPAARFSRMWWRLAVAPRPASPAPLPIHPWVGALEHLRQAGKEVQRSRFCRGIVGLFHQPCGASSCPLGPWCVPLSFNLKGGPPWDGCSHTTPARRTSSMT
jgi:hypothetical protein